MRSVAATAAVAVVAVLVAATAAATAPDDPSSIPPAFEGRRLFVSYCQLCHGPDGKGGGPLARSLHLAPADLTTTVRSRSDTILRKIISGEGRQTITGRDRHNVISAAMPAWKDVLTEPEIDALIAYLRFLGSSPHPLMGNPEGGRKLYEQYCTVCHGEDGDGHGIMTSLLKMEPADHTNPIAMNRLSNEEVLESIADGVGDYMPAWEGILDRDEMEALVSYIRLLAQ